MAVRSTLGFSFLVLFFSLFGGLLQCGGFLRRGVWEEVRSRRRLHLTTHRSSTVSHPFLCIFHNSTNPDHLFSITYRCADVAVPLPHHGRHLPDHVHPVHCTRRHLRPLTFWWSSFIYLHAFPAPIIDNTEPNLRSEPYSTLFLCFATLDYGSCLRYSKHR